jgi:hypothetical protein
MSVRRNPVQVFERIITIIPEYEVGLIQELQLQIVEFYKNNWNKAPELLTNPEYWEPFLNVLNHRVPVIDTPWKQKMLNIVANKEN